MPVTTNLETVESLDAESVIVSVLAESEASTVCLTCSFQAEDMIVLDLLRKRLPQVPVLFLETGYHFSETYQFRDRMTAEWGLNLVNALPKKTVQQQESELGILYREDPAKCCQLRKVEPLMASLEPFEIWFTGLRREQSPTRKNLKKIEQHRLPSGKILLKVSPLADWTWAQVWEYTGKHKLSYLPQYDQGYASIGCEPCTAIPDDPANPRSGRWSGKKLECGIHTFSEKAE
jgi:phosphoadenosine phosphosulfate reductase